MVDSEHAKERARILSISKDNMILKLRQELDSVGWSASQTHTEDKY